MWSGLKQDTGRCRVAFLILPRTGKNIKDFCGKPLMAWAIDNGASAQLLL